MVLRSPKGEWSSMDIPVWEAIQIMIAVVAAAIQRGLITVAGAIFALWTGLEEEICIGIEIGPFVQVQSPTHLYMGIISP